LAGAFRIGLVEIGKHGRDGASEAVDVEAPEFDAGVRRKPLIVGPQPKHEVMHFHVAPYPGGKAREALLLRWRMRLVAHEAIDACGIGPVRFHSNDIEAMPFDQRA
jgi:hypothetical protein